MATSDNNNRNEFWILSITLDNVLSVSDYAVHCLGGNPGLHSIGVSMQFG